MALTSHAGGSRTRRPSCTLGWSSRRWLATSASVALVAAAVIGVRPAAAAPAATQAPPSGTSPVGPAPTLPDHASVQGAMAGQAPLQLTVALEPRDSAGLAALATSVSTPGSPDFRQYLAPGEFADRFGATQATVAAVKAELFRLGLKPGAVSPNRLAISVTTTAAAASAALGVHLRNVRLASGRVAYANDVAPRVPVSVAPAVASIIGLDNLTLDRPHWRAPRPVSAPAADSSSAGNSAPGAPPAVPHAVIAASAAGAQPCTAASSAGALDGGYTADQLAQAYSFGGLYNKNLLGAGVTVAIYELAAYNPADISSFQACYGTSAPITNIAVDGGPNPLDGGAIEAELDIEGVISMAPKANVAVYLGPNGSGFDVYNRIINDDTARVISTSWGLCETSRNPSVAGAENTLFAQAAVQGQTVVAASGDNGSEGCFGEPGHPTNLVADDPSVQPFVTGVGGTKLTALGPAPTETVWNEPALQLGASGGGISQRWLLPPVQHGPGVINFYSSRIPCGAPAPFVCRQAPDVSASADPVNGYVIYYTGTETGAPPGWQTIAGTSAAAPLWAALAALADQACACSVGFLNSALYNIAAQGPGAFNDITAGNNDFLGAHGGQYPATAGYDMGSGLGTPIASSLVAKLTTVAITSPASATFTVGVHGSFTVTTAGAGSAAVSESGALPAGVTFIPATRTLSGTPAQGTAGNYPITFTATTGGGTAATQNFNLTVNQAVFTYPTDGQTNVDTTHLFTWSTIPQAQNYLVIVGTTPFGYDLGNSGILPPTSSSLAVGALPAGRTLHAALFAEVNGTWGSYQAISFTAAASAAIFTNPLNGETGTDPTAAFTWSTLAQAEGYILVVGTHRFGSDVLNSGILPGTQSSFTGPVLPAGRALYATLLTEVNGAFTRFQAIVFTARPAAGTFTLPVNGQVNVATPTAFTWHTIAGAQNYYLVVGTTIFGSDLVNSGLLAPTASSFNVPRFPTGHVLYATLLTEVNGSWDYQLVGFIPAP